MASPAENLKAVWGEASRHTCNPFPVHHNLDRPKFRSSNRREGTPEENATVVRMTESFFGMYSLNDADHTITLHLDRACSAHDPSRQSGLEMSERLHG